MSKVYLVMEDVDRGCCNADSVVAVAVSQEAAERHIAVLKKEDEDKNALIEQYRAFLSQWHKDNPRPDIEGYPEDDAGCAAWATAYYVWKDACEAAMKQWHQDRNLTRSVSTLVEHRTFDIQEHEILE